MTERETRHRIEALEQGLRIARTFLRLLDPTTERRLAWPEGTEPTRVDVCEATRSKCAVSAEVMR